ncbi:MAG: hypothetical protein HC796_00700 [Synechococcaceae cyanobacterium RL_1_2]|nr:hypothetical protein [Synechococcaceae cyanobacterium RL_1_2]
MTKLSKITTKEFKHSLLFVLTAMVCSSILPPTFKVQAQTSSLCFDPNKDQRTVNSFNTASYQFRASDDPTQIIADNTSNIASIKFVYPNIRIKASGISDSDGPIYDLGLIYDALSEELELAGNTQSVANAGALQGISLGLVPIANNATKSSALASIRQAIESNSGASAQSVTDTNLLLALAGLNRISLETYELSDNEINLILSSASSALNQSPGTAQFEVAQKAAFDAAKSAVSTDTAQNFGRCPNQH